MAQHPQKLYGKEYLQPGARGEVFNANLPGYRTEEDRINRSNNRLNTSAHDVLNIKYQFDNRLPVLFRYGFAFGYNQIVVPKGRIVAVDPHMDMVDFDMKKQYNTLTLANGGVAVKVKDVTDYGMTVSDETQTTLISPEFQAGKMGGVQKEWMPLVGYAAAYTDDKHLHTNATTKEALAAEGLKVDPKTGRVVDAEGKEVQVRVGNQPIGIIERNEYTRDDDAYNGMMPGPILTDAMVELPWFLFKDKAESNIWGSAYGGLFPGALVKSDENGRVIPSPLNDVTALATMDVAAYELERQQVIGQVYAVNQNLVPEGAAKYAQWALSDILNFEGFNPDEWANNGRRGEDTINNSPYKSTGEYPGYPYDSNYMQHDLHMLESYRKTYDERMQHEYRFDYGIPGLTDGYNVGKARIKDFNPHTIAKTAAIGSEFILKTIQVDIVEGTLMAHVEGQDDIPVILGAEIVPGLQVTYVDAMQGIFKVKVVAELEDMAVFYVSYEKRGYKEVNGKVEKLNGVPTYMDWDGCIGSVKILLQK